MGASPDLHLPSAGDAGAPELGVVPSVAVTGEPGAAGVLGPFGVPLEGAATPEGSAGGSPFPPHPISAAREARIENELTASRIKVR